MLFDMIDTDKSGTIEAVPVPTVPPPASTRACGDDPRIPRVATENVLMFPQPCDRGGVNEAYISYMECLGSLFYRCCLIVAPFGHIHS